MHVEFRIFLLDRLKLAGGVDGDIPGAGFLANLLVRHFETVNSESDGDVQIRTLFQDASDVGKDSFLNLSVRHDVNRLELVVLVKALRYFRQILARERLAAGKNQDAQIAAQRLRDLFNLVSLHLQLLARTVVQFFCEEAVGTPHVADRCHQNVQQNR